jgi:hypothetical protein
MPAALYPKGKNITYATQTASGAAPAEVKAYLLCGECEGKLNRNGESEVLRLLAPKITRKALPLLSKLRNARPLCTLPDSLAITVYSGPLVGIDTSKFAYFALSLAWRASVHEWTFPDGSKSSPCDLGPYEEPIRRFLLEMAPFPSETAVVMTVCTDDTSRKVWIAPAKGEREDGCWIYRIQMLGLILIVWLGAMIPDHMKLLCCWSAPERPFLSADCNEVTRDMLSGLQPF